MGSNGERYGLRVVAKHADVWMNGLFLRTAAADPDGEDADELSRLSRVLDRHCEDIGRDPTACADGDHGCIALQVDSREAAGDAAG